MTTATRTCVIADDHVIVRDGVRARLSTDRSIEVVGEASNGDDALALIEELQPDVALVDLRMPGLDGFAVAQAVRTRKIPTRIVIYTALASHHLVERGFEAGIDGFVGKESHREVLFMAIDTVLDGGRFVDPAVAARMIGSNVATLSTREQEVLALMAEGLPNTAIAERLSIAPETVRHHVSAVLRKLEANSRTAAVATAFRQAMLL